MFSYKMVGRKPPVYEISFEGTTGLLTKKDKKWYLVEVPDYFSNPDASHEDKIYNSVHRSRRAAFHYFKTGEKFEVTPVYASRGKHKKRIR